MAHQAGRQAGRLTGTEGSSDLIQLLLCPSILHSATHRQHLSSLYLTNHARSCPSANTQCRQLVETIRYTSQYRQPIHYRAQQPTRQLKTLLNETGALRSEGTDTRRYNPNTDGSERRRIINRNERTKRMQT
eukprot:GHVU01004567.1.p1 GENE.GHVU01004567.1~~GHVU01004567.1.p1  ORF type:complete len:132 (+),score=6.50 GHVU01004567.1:51-446(+)